MTDRDTARQQIADLTARYARLTVPARAALTEEELKLQFILPLFRALGWDDTDRDQVTAEEQISRGKADFGFYVRSIPAFYVEAKRVRVGISRADQIAQAISYSYLRGVAWAVITQFEELSVYNAGADTTPEGARFIHLKWTDYAGNGFDDLWLLSREAMSQRPRPIDQVAERYGRILPRRPVTDLLFENLSDWRSQVFQQFMAYRLPTDSYPPGEIDNAVQKLIDRLIFLRTAEDRGIEGAHLREITRTRKPGEWWAALLTLFRQMNGVYNSNLFAPHTLDELHLHDPNLLKSIINGLYQYNRNLTFDFAVIDADVLGAAYEQYLGHKQRAGADVTPETRARQRKRKTQGIYYTPKPIVRYIVDATVGRRLREGVHPYDLRVVDPACGSGSFLIAAFDLLEAWAARLDPAADPHTRRRRILTDCLYGVDLDEQAVEITRLNLVLRASLERARLPMLDHIQRGDSLSDSAAVTPVPFVWRNRFPAVMERGGFDVVLGNPPYVRAEHQTAAFKAYAAEHFQTAAGSADLYVYFIEHGVRLLREGGVYGVIAANKWLRAGYGEKLRAFLRPHLTEIVDFGELRVFQDAATDPAIIIAEKNPVDRPVLMTQVKSLDFDDLGTYLAQQRYQVARTQIAHSSWSLAPAGRANVLERMRAVGVPLSDYIRPAQIRRGVVTGLNEAFIISGARRAEIIRDDPGSAALIKPFVVGDNVRKYQINFEQKYVIFTGRGLNIDDYPGIRNHLLPYRERLEPRPAGHTGLWKGRKAGHYKWFEPQDPTNYHTEFERPKIVYPDIAKESRVALDVEQCYIDSTTFFISTDDLYLLAVLNSHVVWDYLSSVCAVLGDADKGGRLRLKRQYMKTIPIPPVEPDDPRRVRVVELVTEMLALKRRAADRLAGVHDGDLDGQMREIDAAIDRQVRALYAL